jgi:transcriptional regulator GlxA family with amidase domain
VQIAIPIFPGLTALDAVGPYEVLSRIPGAELCFVAVEKGAQRSHQGWLALLADASLDEASAPDVIVVPGGPATRRLLDSPLVEWIRAVHPTTTWTTSVCTGSLLLGAAGVLVGLRATGHWLELERLREFGATPTAQRVVREGKVITSAGVSAGVDMALALAAELAGEDTARAIQLSIEYDPEPPFDSGAPHKAGPALVERVRQGACAALPGAKATLALDPPLCASRAARP